jgi:hypothetical protein
MHRKVKYAALFAIFVNFRSEIFAKTKINFRENFFDAKTKIFVLTLLDTSGKETPLISLYYIWDYFRIPEFLRTHTDLWRNEISYPHGNHILYCNIPVKNCVAFF